MDNFNLLSYLTSAIFLVGLSDAYLHAYMQYVVPQLMHTHY